MWDQWNFKEFNFGWIVLLRYKAYYDISCLFPSHAFMAQAIIISTLPEWKQNLQGNDMLFILQKPGRHCPVNPACWGPGLVY